MSYADVPSGNYITEVASDILIHTWDIGQAILCSVIFNEDEMKFVYDMASPRSDEFIASGLFGTEVEVDETCDSQTKVLALYGRKIKSPTSV